MYQELLTAFNRVAPNGQVQNAMAQIVAMMQRANEPERAIFLTIVHAIVDGMEHGNWPTHPRSES